MANTILDIDVGNILTISESTSPSDTGVSISDNTTVTIDTTSDFDVVNANLDTNDTLTIAVGGDFLCRQHYVFVVFWSLDQNTTLSLSAFGDIVVNDLASVYSDGHHRYWWRFCFVRPDLIGNLPYTTEQYESDFDVVEALPYFTIDAVGIDIGRSEIDFNGPFTLTSSTSDVLITNSDFLDNLYPYIESVTGDIDIESSLLSRNAFIDAYALGD